MKYASLLLQLDDKVLYSPTSLTQMARDIGLFDEDQNEKLLRLRLSMVRQLKHFPQNEGRPVPDGQIELSSRIKVDAWLGDRWIRLALQKELDLFASLFLALQLTESYCATQIVAEARSRTQTGPTKVDDEIVLQVVIHLLKTAPSSSYETTLSADAATIQLTGKSWQILARESLQSSVIVVFRSGHTGNDQS